MSTLMLVHQLKLVANDTRSGLESNNLSNWRKTQLLSLRFSFRASLTVPHQSMTLIVWRNLFDRSN